jgi:hypothetical protein
MAYDWHLFIIFLDSRQTEMLEKCLLSQGFQHNFAPGDSFVLTGPIRARGNTGRGGDPDHAARAVGATPARPRSYRPASPWLYAVEARPQSPLVLISAHFSFGLFMKLFDGIAPIGIPSQLFRHGRGRQIAPVVLRLLRLATGRTLSQ